MLSREVYDFAKSMILFFVTLIVVSQSLSLYVIQPLIFDSTLVRHGRYAITFEAWDTIENDETLSVVGIGSSLTQYGLNGSCIDSTIIDHNINVYNLGIPGAYPYTEMIQIERAVGANPDVIILELNPINLFSFTDAHNIDDYIEMRFTINSLFMKHTDNGDWKELIRDNDLDYIDHSILNPYNSEKTYFNQATEQHLKSLFGSEINDGSWAKNEGLQYFTVPDPESKGWENYLKNPVLLPRYLDSFNSSELSYYENFTILEHLNRARYNPDSEINLNKLAFEYMVESFSKNNIETILISYPIYPKAVEMLNDNQLDEHNNTISNLLKYDNVKSLNLIWLDIWDNQDFYDIEHLDSHGREKLCSIISSDVYESL